MVGRNNPGFLVFHSGIYQQPSCLSLGPGEGKTHVLCTSYGDTQGRLDFTMVSMSQSQSSCLFPGLLLISRNPSS